MAVREILKYPAVRKVTLVDLDKDMTSLFSSQEMLTKLNANSLSDKKVNVINGDAFTWLRTDTTTWDAIVIDFPDPSSFSIGKLYSTLFYSTIRTKLRPNGIAVVQSTSPYVAPKSFWCIDTTLKSVGFYTRPYHNYVPSFGEWGYIMASPQPVTKWFTHLPVGLKFLNEQILSQMFVFPEDMKVKQGVEINKLNNQSLVNYFEEEWGKYLD
jgi:spermidine synthase